MNFFERQGDSLIFRENGETVMLTPWGRDGLRVRATFLGACRLGLVLGPVVLVLPPLLGQLGVQIAQPVTDILTTLIAVPMAYFMLREMHAEEDKMMRTSLYGEDA